MSGQVYEIAFRMNAAVSSSMRNAFNQANQSLGELESGSNTLNKSMGVLSKGAIAAGAAFAGIATGIGIAVKATDEYNTAMKHIQASTGTAIGDMKEIKQISKNLYNANLGEDWNDLAESISLTKSVSKLSGKELEAATKNALIYRDVWGEDISQSLKATDTMMKNFGISSTQAYNLLAQGAQKGLNKSDELMDSANEYTPYFKTLGFSANQMFDVFSAGLENGAFNLDKVGDAVKEFGIRSKDGSKASMEAYKMIGLSGDKMTQTFAKGGPEAQKAFSQVVDAIKKVKDPAVQNAAAVGLFGTQAEDLEMKVITSMGNVASQFDMAKNTMKEVGNVKYDTLTQSLQGIGRQIETGILIPIGEKVLPKMQAFSDAIKTNMPAVKKVIDNSMGGLGKTMDMAGSGLQKAFIAMAPALKSAESAIRPVISQIGESVLGIWRQITSFWNKNGASITSGFVMAAKVFGAVIGGLIGIFKSLLPIVMPIVSTIATFVMDTFAKVAAYWNENGAMILQAVQNVFAGINAVIQFLAPVILFILQSVWYNVAGVIQGALNIIMGLVTFFSALFTGNFGKMWEGVKQLFFGAIQFVWNLLSLMFVGKIITSIKSLASGVTGRIGGMWTKVKEFFDGGIAGVWTSVMGLGPKIAQGFQAAKDIAVGFARGMWNSIKQFFGNIVQGARELPGKIGQGISSMAGKALEGLKSMGNLLLSGIGTMVNGVIKGLNFVMSKLGMDLTINEWVVPQYAKGTSGHPGGLAILGDGGGPELYRTPNGHVGLSPGTDTLMNLPKGTQVVPAKETQMILSSTIPAYKNGNIGDAFNTGLNWVKGAGVAAGNAVKDTAVKAAGGVKAGAMKVKDATFDVFSYVSDPEKLLSKVMEQFGVKVPPFNGTLGNVASGAFKMVKNNALSFLKGKLEGFGTWSGGKAAPAQVQNWLKSAIGITGVPMSWLGPLQTMAMKESGGNPRAINLWDSNAKKGTPSKGLLQTIDPTFNAYKMPGMNDIWNPIHNAVAAIRYTLSRYGSIFNTPGIKNMSKGGGYKGYYKGGKVPNSQWAWVGERGPELLKLPGGSEVFSNGESQGMLSGMIGYAEGSGGQVASGNSGTVQQISFPYNPEIKVEGTADASVIERALQAGHGEFKNMILQVMKEIEERNNRLKFT